MAATLLKCAPSNTITDEQVTVLCTLFPNITTLHLRHCDNLSDEAVLNLAKLPKLSELDLSSCDGLIGDLEPADDLATLSNLQILNLESSDELTDLCCFGTLPSLEFLNLDHCDNITPEALLLISSYSSLRCLNLTQSLSGPILEGIGTLLCLEELYLCLDEQETDISGPLINMVSPLSRLYYLDLTYSFLSPAVLREFCDYPRDIEFRMEEIYTDEKIDQETVLKMLGEKSPFGAQLLALEKLNPDGFLGHEEVFLRAGGLLAVIATMWQGNKIIDRAAFKVMSGLAWRNHTFQSSFLELGLISKICSMLPLEDGFDGRLVLAAGDFLFSLCRYGNGGLLALRESGGMPELMSLLIKTAGTAGNDDFGEGKMLASSLARLRMVNPAVEEDIGRNRVVERMLMEPFVVDTRDASDISRIEVLALLVKGIPMSEGAFLGAGGVLKVLSLLEARPLYSDRVTAVAKVVSELGQSSPECARAFCKADTMSKLVGILEGSVPVVYLFTIFDNNVEDIQMMRVAVSKAMGVLIEAAPFNVIVEESDFLANFS